MTVVGGSSQTLARSQARLGIMTTVPLSEAKDRLSALVEAAETTHEIVTITRHGREAAVLMAQSDLDSLHETIFWLSQPGGSGRHRAGAARARRGADRLRQRSADGVRAPGVSSSCEVRISSSA